MERHPAVYMLTNRPDGTLYIGVTSNLPRRISEHKHRISRGFSARYNLSVLVYFELYEDMYQAITREKQLKAGSRKAKVKLIESVNPEWRDLFRDICD